MPAHLAEGYRSLSQPARLVTKVSVSENMYRLARDVEALERLPANVKVADFPVRTVARNTGLRARASRSGKGSSIPPMDQFSK
jgi:hypothetical protein